MKKTISILLLSLFLLSLSTGETKAQDDKNFRFTVKTNPLAAIWGPIPFTSEYKVWLEASTFGKQSATLGVSYLGPNIILNLEDLVEAGSDVNVNVGGFRAQFTYKFVLTSGGNGPEGFYLAPNISYATATFENKDVTDDYVKGTKLNINGLLGYQLITDGGFVLDVHTGFGYKMRDWEFGVDNSEFDLGEFPGSDGIAVIFGVGFGYAF
jgi:hypothetical protein